MVPGVSLHFSLSQGLHSLVVALMTLSPSALVSPARASSPIRVKDLEYIHQVYFFMADHPVEFDRASLRVWRDDDNWSNNAATAALSGKARLDPLVPPDSDQNPEWIGAFDLLVPGEGYDLIHPYLNPGPNLEIPVIRLTSPLAVGEVLAVSYLERIGGEWVKVGNDDLAESDSVLGKDEGEVLLRLIGPPMNVIRTVPGGDFDRTSPLYPSLRYQLKNFYRLGIQNFPRENLRITIRRADAGFPIDPDSFGGIPFIRLLGLDQSGPLVDSPPDGKVDDRFVWEGGVLFFPDLHPFNPDTVAGNCPPGAGGLLCLDNLTRNPLQECPDPDVCIANPNVYDMKYPDPMTQYRFYLEVSLREPLAPGSLRQNRPNPFRSGTTIEFESQDAGPVRLTVHDIQGRLVKVLVRDVVPAGPNVFTWDGKNAAGRRVSSGVYLCRLEGAGSIVSRRMVLLH